MTCSCHITTCILKLGDNMQINRMFEIIYILLDKKTVTAGYLAEHFEVSPRTIYRDVETLSAAGIPIYMTKGKNGGISLMSDFVLNKTVLTDTEKTDIICSLKALKYLDSNEANTALEKLGSLFGEMNADWIEVDFTSWTRENKSKEIFDNIKNAILHKHGINFDYSSVKGEDTKRFVYPLKLCYKQNGWYVYGYCNNRQDYRFFKLSRIRYLDTSGESFDLVPPKELFNKQNVFAEEFFKLVLKLSPKMAYRVYDEFDSYEKLEDGSFLAEVMFPVGDWFFSYIASFGDDCTVIEPEYVKNQVIEKFKKVLKNYL